VAEELHFGRAAERLHMSQSPLSRAIRELERDLGVVLFVRTTRRVELTAAGLALLERSRRALVEIDGAIAEARRARRARRMACSVLAMGRSAGRSRPRSAMPLAHPSKWHGVVTLTLEEFTYGFVNTFSAQGAASAYERYAVPETGQIFYEAGFANFHLHPPTEVHFKNHDRAPLLIVGATDDKTVPASLSKAQFKRYERSPAKTDYLEFEGRPHLHMAAPDWQEVAVAIDGWPAGTQTRYANRRSPVCPPAASPSRTRSQRSSRCSHHPTLPTSPVPTM
jgi:hypothetical protein